MGRVVKQCLRKRALRTGGRGWLLWAACAGALLLQLVLGGTAAAQEEPDAAETAAARALAVEGVKLADAGRCDEAVDKLARAEKLHHALVVLGRLGECQVLLGNLVDGTENLRKVLREPLPADAPAVLLKARERAHNVLERTNGRIGQLHITVRGPEDQTALSVTVDGQPMHLALLGADRPTDPGEHVVVARAPGYLDASARVLLGIGEKQTLLLQLDPDPNASASTRPLANPSPVATDAPSRGQMLVPSHMEAPRAPVLDMPAGDVGSSEVDHTGAYIAWGAGGATLAVSAVFGLIALDGKNDLKAQCPNGVCPPESSDRLDSARGASTAATVLVIAGGASVALGTLLYFLAGSSDDTGAVGGARSRSPARGDSRDPASPRAWVGLGQVGLSGEF